MERRQAESGLARRAFGRSRPSAQRLAIAQAATTLRGRAFSVEDLADEVRASAPGIGLATVYRAIAAMEIAGFIEQLGLREGSALYALCPGGGHHHHLLCTSCNAVADVVCPVPSPGEAEGGAGFRVTGHRLVLYGVCDACDAGSTDDATLRGEADCCGSGSVA